jgi:hypothetical protein
MSTENTEWHNVPFWDSGPRTGPERGRGRILVENADGHCYEVGNTYTGPCYVVVAGKNYKFHTWVEDGERNWSLPLILPSYQGGQGE